MASMTWRSRSTHKSNPPPTLGILAFETAKTMSRLLALHKSLSDDEFFELRKGTMKSRGVAYLNSTDESYLFSLACAEKLEELNRVAMSASRLGQRCSDSDGNNFDMQSVSANDEKEVEKMEKYVASTAKLYSALETLNQLELSEKKVKLWKLNVDPKRSPSPNFGYFDEKIAYQRKQVQYYKNTSLWSRTCDKIVALMVRIVYTVYARICIVFGPFVSGLPSFFKDAPRNISLPKPVRVRVHPEADYCLLAYRDKFIQELPVKSGPLPRTLKKLAAIRFYSHELLPKYPISSIAKTVQTVTDQTVIESAPPSTVGSAGLAMRYANIIVLAERYLNTSMCVNDEAREILYEMLPARIKTKVREKMRGAWGGEEEEMGRDGSDLAEGWRQAVEDIMTWLAPMAQDTVVKWVEHFGV
ncbi:hypothetical protein HS088_TW03G01254 [Tripterygium wilfordii]|uniref:Uncharacterized protein n=1 Tax=Tripterygium wilfordii TaxID=458696 RepID=A0A7J7DXL0_TRIWF|nr:hypothetical protein HS088_TW03G01254 [Tripterygium wilfordii]